MIIPLYDYDANQNALIEPSRIIKKREGPRDCVICFFHEVIEDIVDKHNARLLLTDKWECGEHHFYEIEHSGNRLAFFHPGVGAPHAVGLLEAAIAMGCKRFIAVGGCGTLQTDLAVGHLIVVHSAIRDEGCSFHYLPASREVESDDAMRARIEQELIARNLPTTVGKTWTTDAPYRETKVKIQSRRNEGAIVVEMESAALIAACRFRGVEFGQILYSGDDLSGDSWDPRGWSHRTDIRNNLFWLAADILTSDPPATIQ